MVAKNHHKFEDVVSHRITATISWFHERFPCELSSEERTQKFHTDDVTLLSAGQCFWLVGNLLQTITSAIQIWVLTSHQCGISELVLQTSFRGKPFCGVAKCRLFLVHLNQTTFRDATNGFPAKWRLRSEGGNSILMTRECQDLASASDRSCRLRNLLQPIRGTT